MRLSLILIALTTLAQTPDPSALVEARFKAGTPPDLAWAARLAADNGLQQYTPQVIELLRHADDRVRTTAWDALVNLRAKVPDDLLEPAIRSGRNNAAVILAAMNSPDVAARLLDENTVGDSAWLVLTGSLFPAGDASRLLRQWTIPVTVIVTDGNRAPQPPDPQPSGGLCGDSFGEPPSPYPSRRFPVYRPMDGVGKPLTTGPHPISYGYNTCFGRIPEMSRDIYAFDFLQALADFHAPLPQHAIRYSSATQFRAAANSTLASIRAYYNRLHRALLAKHAIPADDHTIPPLKVNVIDQRLNGSRPLPEIDWRLAAQK